MRSLYYKNFRKLGVEKISVRLTKKTGFQICRMLKEDMEDMVEAVEARTWLKKKKASLPNALIMHFSSGSFRSARPPALNAECWMMMNPSCAESLLRVGCIANAHTHTHICLGGLCAYVSVCLCVCVSVCLCLRRRVFAPNTQR